MFKQTTATRITAALGLLMAIWAMGAAVPAPITIDDVSYQLMARDWSAGRGLTIWNGYEEHPSPELQLIVPGNASQIAAHDGRLVSQYPQGYAVISAPLYAQFGLKGLFWLNGLSGGFALFLTGALARTLGGSPKQVILSVLILGLNTFFTDYMVGVPPHPLVSALTLASWLLVERALEAEDRRLQPLIAGLLLSVALGVRLDSFVFLPVLAVLIATDPRGRLSQILGLALGVLPALALLSWTNLLKFHTASPLSYGNAISHTAGVGAYLPVLLFALPGALALIALGRPGIRARVSRRQALLAVLVLLGLSAAIPSTRALTQDFFRGSWALWGDLRDSPASGIEPSDTISAGGAMYHWGSIKKALCQSCPWLGLAPLWIWTALGEGDRAAKLRRLLLVPVALTGLYGLRAYHGGGSLNLRYFVPALPFLAIAAAFTLSDLMAEAKRGGAPLAVLLGGLGLALPTLLAPSPSMPVPLQERFYLDLPLSLCAGVGIAGLAWAALRALSRPRGGLALIALSLTLAGLGWAAGVNWAYDVPRRLEVRERNQRLGAAIATAAEGGGVLVFGALAEHIGLAAELPDTRMALAPIDQGADMAALITFHYQAGRSCLGLFSRTSWERIGALGVIKSVQTESLWSDGTFELRRFTPARREPPPSRVPPSSPSGG